MENYCAVLRSSEFLLAGVSRPRDARGAAIPVGDSLVGSLNCIWYRVVLQP
jgi:hypothetical protein